MLDYCNRLLAEMTWWDAVGYAGQLIFASRFLVQWIASEREGKSVVPVSFWYLSIIGSLICLTYALETRRVPFIVGYLFNCIPYIRNLMLLGSKKRKSSLAKVCEHCGEELAT
jgi:lipid-A-disaccharide synthase-like uncharacterized protein